MKLTDDLVAKYGVDKLLHFAFGGWMVSFIGEYGFWAACVAYVILFIISVWKEKKLDSVCDWVDLYAAMIGGTIALLNVGIACLVI